MNENSFPLTYICRHTCLFLINNHLESNFHLYSYPLRIRAQASTMAGYGPYGTELEVSTLSGTPSYPINLRSIGDSSNLVITWSQEGREEITMYKIRVIFKNSTVSGIFLWGLLSA